MTTLVINSSSADGYIKSVDPVFNTARSGGTLTAHTAFPDWLIIGVDNPSSYVVYQSFLSFDTSSISSFANISSVTLSLYGGPDYSSDDFEIQCRIYNWGSTLTVGDWISGSSLSTYTTVATRSSAGWNAAGYNDFTDVAFPANINKGGTTFIVINSEDQISGSPLFPAYILAVPAEGISAERPKLTIIYTLESTLSGSMPAPAGAISKTVNKTMAGAMPAPTGTVTLIHNLDGAMPAPTGTLRAFLSTSNLTGSHPAPTGGITYSLISRQIFPGSISQLRIRGIIDFRTGKFIR